MVGEDYVEESKETENDENAIDDDDDDNGHDENEDDVPWCEESEDSDQES